jgi:methylmalonyl-CoA/ethylmalonyl-CoA epimerase
VGTQAWILTEDRCRSPGCNREVAETGTATDDSGPLFFCYNPNMTVRLDHIGIAVANIPELTRLFNILGLGITHTEPVPDQGVATHFLPIPSHPTQPTSLEFLEPVDPAGTIAKFLQKRGPGIHHLSFVVDPGTLDSLCAQIRAAGYRLIYDQARNGAHQMRINFIHPGSAGGMLIELMEKRG